jgi:hypothetical protein
MKRLGIISTPLAFVLAGSGMLLLRRVETAPGDVYEQIASRGQDWLLAHVILLASTVFLVPAALAIRTAIRGRGLGYLGTAMLVVIAPTAILLAGQYAIDFITPTLVDVGGEALVAKDRLGDSALIGTLFYGLPNLVFLALMILSLAAVWSGTTSRTRAVLLTINWLAVLLGNLVHPVFQRIAIMLLGVSTLPLVTWMWRPHPSEQEMHH